MRWNAPDVVILSDDFAGLAPKSCFRMTPSRQEAEFFPALDGLGAAGGSDFIEDAGAVGLDCVFGDEKLRRDFAIAEAARDQRQNLELTRRDAER